MYSEGPVQVDDTVAGNARITGGTAAMLLVLLAAEGVTIPLIGSLRGPHIFIGMLLIPPVLLKLGSTGWRFARYYAGDGGYRRKGPPAMAMRLLAPEPRSPPWRSLHGSDAVGRGSGGSGSLRFLHKASFILWFALMSVHVLGHLLEVPNLAIADWRPRGGREAALAGSGLRLSLLGASLLAGLALALATLSLAGPWLSGPPGH